MVSLLNVYNVMLGERERGSQSTFEVAYTTHGGEHSGLHLDVPDSGVVSFPQVLQLLLGGEGAQSSVKPALT